MRPHACLLAVLLAPTAFAQTVNVPPVVVNALTHAHVVDIVPTITTTRDAVTFPCGAGCNGPAFSATIVLGTEVVVRIQPPPGQRFRVIHSGVGSQVLFANATWATGVPDSASHLATPTITYEGLTGTAPATTFTLTRVWDAGQVVAAQLQASVLADFAFTALEIRFPVNHALAAVLRNYGVVGSSSAPSFGSSRVVSGTAADTTLMVIESIPGPYCSGDGSGTFCPCSPAPLPHGLPGRGCPHPFTNQGSLLLTSGVASLAADTLVLQGFLMSNSSCVYYQGNARENSGLGSVFGDGLRCATGGVQRFKTKTNFGNASQYPGPGDPLISVAGLVGAPGEKHYQAWFRSAAPGFCTVATHNLTNGYTVLWGP